MNGPFDRPALEAIVRLAVSDCGLVASRSEHSKQRHAFVLAVGLDGRQLAVHIRGNTAKSEQDVRRYVAGMICQAIHESSVHSMTVNIVHLDYV